MGSNCRAPAASYFRSAAAAPGMAAGPVRAPRRQSGRVALVLAVATCLASCADADDGLALPPADSALERELVAEVTGAGAIRHLEALQRIADDNGGHRPSPSPGYEASVDYVSGVLSAAGYDVTTPTYPVQVGRQSDERELELRNVVAQSRTGSAGSVVLIGAHLDSVDDGPGINDNGSGVAALLEIAQRLGGSPRASNAVRFAFWGSEEDGLTGSTHYVETLEDPGTVLLYLNVDMVASPNAGYFVQGGEGRGASEEGPQGSANVAQVLVEQLDRLSVTAERVPFDGESDYDAFLEAGIPSGGVFTGDDEEKTGEQAELWGGQAGEEFDPCYHEACDDLDNVDEDALHRLTVALAGAVTRFASADQL